MKHKMFIAFQHVKQRIELGLDSSESGSYMQGYMRAREEASQTVLADSGEDMAELSSRVRNLGEHEVDAHTGEVKLNG